MKTFEEFVNEGMAKHYIAHYAKAALRAVTPGYNDIRQISTQRAVDKFRLHSKIADDEDLQTSTRMKHKAKAQKQLEKLAKKLDLPSFAQPEVSDEFDDYNGYQSSSREMVRYGQGRN